MKSEEAYLQLLSDVRNNGTLSEDRTGVGTYKVFGRMWTCEDVENDFPLLTTKRVHFKSVVGELLWFLSGSTNVRDLQELGCTIWDEWADPDTGELGPGYGFQWRNYNGWYPWPHHGERLQNGVDQIAGAVKMLEEDPNSRRNMVLAWNPQQTGKMALPACHYAFQLATNGRDLNMMVNMRSIDIFLGLPFNIASYALLLKMFAHVTGYRAKRLCFSLGDLHIYKNHLEQVDTQLGRMPFKSPNVTLEKSVSCLEAFTTETVHLDSYKCHPGIRAEVAV